MQDQTGSLSLVTVFFEAEIDLLALQARSLDVFARDVRFDKIVLIDNTERGLGVRKRARLTRLYGDAGSRVEFVRPSQLVDLPHLPGWVGQQVLKLMVSRLIRSRHYLVLDAKNHWIEPTDLRTFVAADGRAHGASHTYRGHALEKQVEGVLRYMGLEPEQLLDSFPVTHTPVVLETAVVADMIDHIEHRSGKPFAVEFVDQKLLEFPLYHSWIVATEGTIGRRIDGVVIRSTTLWPSISSEAAVSDLKLLTDNGEADSPFLGIHRSALARANSATAAVLADLWATRGLTPTRQAGRRLIVVFKVRYLTSMSVRKFRGLLRRSST